MRRAFIFIAQKIVTHNLLMNNMVLAFEFLNAVPYYFYREGKSMPDNEESVRGGFFDNKHSGCSNDNQLWLIIAIILVFLCFCGNRHHDC